MRLREKDLKLCKFCKRKIYQIPSTAMAGAWYDMVDHNIRCPIQDALHKPEENNAR